MWGSKIVFVSGGGGTRGLATALTRYTHNATYVIGGTDNGGGTRFIRQFFPHLPAVGDWRSRYLDLADRRAAPFKQATTLLGYRFSGAATPDSLERELESMSSGCHPLVRMVSSQSPETANNIRDVIGYFDAERKRAQARLGHPFPLQNGSIGNFFLAGELLRNGGDVTKCLSLLARLINARGMVLPPTLGSYQLQTELEDGTTQVGQQHFSAKDPEYQPGNSVRVKRISYCRFEHDFSTGQLTHVTPATPELNPQVREALSGAEAIVFAMGSFYMSILSVLMIPGFGACIRESKAPKIMIGNPIYESESFGLTMALMAKTLIEYLRKSDSSSGKDSDYLNRLVFHNSPTSRRSRIPLHRRELPAGIEVLPFPLLGKDDKYDPKLLAEIVVSFTKT